MARLNRAGLQDGEQLDDLKRIIDKLTAERNSLHCSPKARQALAQLTRGRGAVTPAFHAFSPIEMRCH